MKTSPSPWRIDNESEMGVIRDGNGYMVGTFLTLPDGHLMASAPILRSALEEVCDDIRDLTLSFRSERDRCIFAKEITAKIRAAIASAQLT